VPAKFTDQDVRTPLKRKRALSQYLDYLVRLYRPQLKRIQLQFVFCTDSQLHTINMQFLQHDTYTDIITFDLSEKASELVSELYISTERVRENAQIFETDFQTELHRVIFHGVLHLCGLEDKKKADMVAMRQAEDNALVQWTALIS